ncbi:MAG: 50S ribosomal protein L11 methyltransferase [Candidatus Levybacteria bacterium]|nr:50S ribosomal protein L11 methyltransferase [Candidatus Levybacteria bacterium]
MSFFLVNLILLIIIALLLILLSWIWPPDSPWSPWWTTKDHEIRQALKLAKVTKKDTVYELGCGNGRFLIIAAKEFGARGVGIEIDPLRFFIATLMIHINRVSDKVVIKRKNFFDENLSKATVVYVYLVPKALKRLAPKFKEELKKDTRIVSYRYETPLMLKKHRTASNLRLYLV